MWSPPPNVGPSHMHSTVERKCNWWQKVKEEKQHDCVKSNEISPHVKCMKSLFSKWRIDIHKLNKQTPV